jgi:glutamate--cysteine ligase catalytic subunit
MTNGKFIRQFVLNHPNYKHDSIVSEEINFDLFCQIDKILTGDIPLVEALKRN